MDLTQRKLTKSEWESIEVPVSENEKEIAKLIKKGFHDINIRYNNMQTATKLKKKINSIIKKIVKKQNCRFKIKYLENGESFLTLPDKNIFLAKKIIKKITKKNPVFSTTGGTSDARFIKKIAPCLEFGLVNKTMHKIDECVSLKDLRNLKKIYYNFLLEFFK